MNSDWITSAELLKRFGLTREEAIALILQGVLKPYLLEKNRIFVGGAFELQYSPFNEYNAQHQPKSYAYSVTNSFGSLYFRQNEISFLLLPDKKKWEALLETYTKGRDPEAIRAAIMKFDGKTHAEIVFALYPGREGTNKSLITQLKPIAQRIAAEQSPPLVMPPWGPKDKV